MSTNVQATHYRTAPPQNLPHHSNAHSTAPVPSAEPSLSSAQTPASATAPGPALGPVAGPAAPPPPMPELGPTTNSEQHDASAPPSPYTATRLIVRNLTMPPIPNFQIPPSPSGSPPPATTAKFARFLELKTKGSHFNQRLDQSSALRNPSLLTKLMDFAGVSQEDQYATPWSKERAIATKFPDWAYGDKLVSAHEKIAKKKEQERVKAPREALDFVPAKQEVSASGSGRVERREDRRGRFDNQRRRSRSPR